MSPLSDDMMCECWQTAYRTVRQQRFTPYWLHTDTDDGLSMWLHRHTNVQLVRHRRWTSLCSQAHWPNFYNYILPM